MTQDPNKICCSCPIATSHPRAPGKPTCQMARRANNRRRRELVSLPLVLMPLKVEAEEARDPGCLDFIWDYTPQKTNIDTKNNGVEDVSPFRYGYFGYPC